MKDKALLNAFGAVLFVVAFATVILAVSYDYDFSTAGKLSREVKNQQSTGAEMVYVGTGPIVAVKRLEIADDGPGKTKEVIYLFQVAVPMADDGSGAVNVWTTPYQVAIPNSVDYVAGKKMRVFSVMVADSPPLRYYLSKD